MNSISNYIRHEKSRSFNFVAFSFYFRWAGNEICTRTPLFNFCSGGGLKCKCAAHSSRSDTLQSIESDGCGSGIVYNVFSVDVECSANIPKIMVFQRFI